MQDNSLILENNGVIPESCSEEALLHHLISLRSQVKEDPIEGLAGYLVTEDPTYLPENTELKVLIRMIGRDKLLRLLLSDILKHHTQAEEA